MQTINCIRISAEPDAVFEAASGILDWPRILPHYRWVRQLEDNAVFEMAARRSWIPVKWTSQVRLDPAARRIYFTHVGGLTKGMEVVWAIEPVDGETSVCIIHELAGMTMPVVRSAPGRLLTGRVFVEHIAEQTLRHMKLWIEKKCGARSSLV